MDNGIYTTLARQSGLMREMALVANNIANASTTGFRREGTIFAEHVADLGANTPSLSIASAEGRIVNEAQGVLQQTGGTFDFAIEGDGYFMIQTPQGNLLSRAGAFAASPEGTLTTPDGYALLDAGGTPVTLPPGAGRPTLAQDGTLSVGGEPVAQVGLFRPATPGDLIEAGSARYRTMAPPESVENGTLFQGFLEQSNVNAVAEISRMIAVQRAYEMGQNLLEAEDGRIRSVIQTAGR